MKSLFYLCSRAWNRLKDEYRIYKLLTTNLMSFDRVRFSDQSHGLDRLFEEISKDEVLLLDELKRLQELYPHKSLTELRFERVYSYVISFPMWMENEDTIALIRRVFPGYFRFFRGLDQHGRLEGLETTPSMAFYESNDLATHVVFCISFFKTPNFFQNLLG